MKDGCDEIEFLVLVRYLDMDIGPLGWVLPIVKVGACQFSYFVINKSSSPL